ncbi:c-type cytochrome [Rubellimicrobium rubrum]|uniref:C-type cytochrome n=1 Tax=Rubellimicrobium rubrum TaxID=2585369 RepID=A0A5C4MVE3_9RHOB|nr:c-type cytochrome [Rubellimicrobium rubrum]TNC49345.1 c-type cytochrome [Rubellimicrobium rubrum]
MFDTMTLTKIVGGFCGTLLVFLLGGWAAQAIYGGGETHVAEGEELHQAYVIPVESGEGGEAVAEVTPEQLTAEFQEAFAAADPAAGEGEFRPCSACHSLAQGENRTGPTLYGVVDRPVDAIEGFDYSGALEQVAESWTADALNLFILAPTDYAPGTKMNFNGIKDVQDRANLIAYLATNPGG